MSACYCIGPPGNCPCIRRGREVEAFRDYMSVIRPDVFDKFFGPGPDEKPAKRDPMKAMG